ncbi:hypothetical protein M2160_009317 [Streptomyces sp. SAI-117]|jgi:hypothetical protein|nr:hypothetical protein [Streptomyces sp. SAI-117]MDH6581055.1 hypothetical protein [Streptomyces sp. SAI-133]
MRAAVLTPTPGIEVRTFERHLTALRVKPEWLRGAGEGSEFVVGNLLLQAVMEHSQHAVEQIALGGGVPVTAVAPTATVSVCTGRDGDGGEWRAKPVPETGEWGGGRVEDPYDDFVGRYMFAFLRLNSQGIKAVSSPAAATGTAAE